MAEETPFQQLIRRVRSGDQQAAADLLQRYEPTIRRIARVRLTDSGLQRVLDSMDICQSVFASFFVRTAMGQYEIEEPQQLLNLLVNMSRKKVVNHLREQHAARRDYRRLETISPDHGNVRAPGSSPSQHVETKEILEEFRKRLSEDERQLADARAQGRDWAEIAVEKGENPDALRKRLARAIDRIAQEIGLEE